jgi:Protein of unknown function (DUF1656)
MRFAEIDLFGVYVAPIPLMMVGAWLVTIALRRLANRSGLLQYVSCSARGEQGRKLFVGAHPHEHRRGLRDRH